MYKFIFFVPVAYAESVKQAVFNSGAGRIGHYKECCWETQGVGQFRPTKGSNPFIGEADNLERVPELKVEMLCKEQAIHNVVKVFKQAHPYEEPAYEVIRIEDF